MSASLSWKQHLLNGGKSYGPMLMSNSPIIAELLSSIPGYSHVILDQEHSVTDMASTQTMLQAVRAAGAGAATATAPIVRAPDHSATHLKKILDSLTLPAGLLVPMVDTPEQAERIVHATTYPRQEWQQTTTGTGAGARGCAAPFVRGTAWGLQDPRSYFDQCHDGLLRIVQVETPLGVDNIPEIAEVDGVDMIFLGPLDLSCSVGQMGRWEPGSPARELLEAAERRVRESGAMLGGFRPPHRDLREMFEQARYSLVCGSVDMGLLRDAAKADAQSGQPYLE